MALDAGPGLNRLGDEEITWGAKDRENRVTQNPDTEHTRNRMYLAETCFLESHMAPRTAYSVS